MNGGAGTTRETGLLVVEIEIPDFYIEASATDEDAEVAMDLANHLVTVTFATHEGDIPGVVLRAMEGRIAGVKVRRAR